VSRPGTLLIILSGRDRPGVTADLFAALRHYPVSVEDMEQIVVRGRLMLAVLLGLDAHSVTDVTDSVTAVARRLNMEVEIVPGASEEPSASSPRAHITVLGSPLQPVHVARLADTISVHGGNIDRIRRVADYPVTAVVFEGSGVDVQRLRSELVPICVELGVDIAVQEAGLTRRGQRLIVMDVDSTLIQDEVIDLLADRAARGEEVARITDQAMRGEIDFTESLRQRVHTLAGLPDSVITEVQSAIRLTPGARTLVRTLKALGFHICLVSGGFRQVIEPLAAELGIDRVRANELEISDGVLTGRVTGEIIDRSGKRRALEDFAAEFHVPLSQVIAVGDGANDLDMLAVAGLGVAFNAKPAVREVADTSVSRPYLDSILFLLGVTRAEIEAADRQQGIEVRRPVIERSD
jgi:phosphoserine phosphatase